MRIVPDQDPGRISKAFDEAVHAFAPAGVRVEINTLAVASAYLSDLGSPGMKAAAAAIEAAFGVPPVFIREGGSLPILPLFKEVLGADSLMLGFCLPNCNAHGPNEFLHLDDFHNGTKAATHFVHALAQSR
jgi:succinyl-diaminopimelate desuccinylase